MISSAISCLNVLNRRDDASEKDVDEDDYSSDDSAAEEKSKRGASLLSPTKSMIRKTLVSPLKMGSPGRDSMTDRSLSPMRRGSVQSRNSLRGARTQPGQILADYRALVNLRKMLTNKFGTLSTVFAFSVLLGGFERKLMIRPVLTATIPTSQSKQEIEVKGMCLFFFLILITGIKSSHSARKLSACHF